MQKKRHEELWSRTLAEVVKLAAGMPQDEGDSLVEKVLGHLPAAVRDKSRALVQGAIELARLMEVRSGWLETDEGALGQIPVVLIASCRLRPTW